MTASFDLFVFGATSDLVQQLFVAERAWFQQRVRKLILVQRGTEVAAAYQGFAVEVEQADVSDVAAFGARLEQIVARHASAAFPMHVLPTYGVFNWTYAEKSPRFIHTASGLQINLNCRLQIIDAFRKFSANTRFHLLGSLFANFPYLGDCALSMWYINQLPHDPAYANLDLRIYNLGGMKTRFWNHASGPKNNPFVYEQVPTREMVTAMDAPRRGAMTFYPSLPSRFACWLGRRGIRVM
jgi:hypothetical protein